MAKIGRPVTVDSNNLSSSTVSATSAWSGSTVYAQGDVVSNSDDLPREYTSKTGHTVSWTGGSITVNGSTDVITINSHGLSDGDLVAFEWVASWGSVVEYQQYYVINSTTHTFQISETEGGSAFNLVSEPTSMVTYASPGEVWTMNIGNAITDTDHWIATGPTNRYAMFDPYSTRRTVSNSDITVVIDLGSDRVDCMQFLDLVNITQIRIQANDGSDYYDETYSLADTSFSQEWYTVAGHYTETRFKSAHGVTNIEPKAGTTLTITFTVTGTGEVGTCVPGLSNELGGVEYGAGLGIANWSDISRNIYGTISVVERAYANQGEFDVIVLANLADAFFNIMASFRAMPLMWFMVPDGSDTGWAPRGLYYGIYKRFRENIAYYDRVTYILELEGLGNG